MKEISQLDNAHEFTKLPNYQTTKLPNSWEERGKKKGKIEVAFEMLKEGASIEFIAKVTKLEQAEIEQLKKESHE